MHHLNEVDFKLLKNKSDYKKQNNKVQILITKLMLIHICPQKVFS